jgi:hypothetical protein
MAENESEPAAREKALEAVAWDSIDVDPELAREAFASLPPGGEAARRLVGHFAMRMADEDPESALAWARALEQSEERGDAIGRIAVVISATDAARAATLVADEVPEGPPRDRAIVQVVQRWSQAAPAEAAVWIASFPAGKVREASLQSLAAAWIEADAPAFEAWAVKQEALLPEAAAAAAVALRNFPDGSTRNQRLDLFADEAFRQRVREALRE